MLNESAEEMPFLDQDIEVIPLCEEQQTKSPGHRVSRLTGPIYIHALWVILNVIISITVIRAKSRNCTRVPYCG